MGEDGELTMDTLPESGFVKTFSNDAQGRQRAVHVRLHDRREDEQRSHLHVQQYPGQIPTADFTSNCGSGNGQPVSTLLELAKAGGKATGVVTTTRVTHATPAATYSHVCHRDAESDIAAQLVPGGALYNAKLQDGVDVVFGGGRQFFLPRPAASAPMAATWWRS